MSYEVYTAPTLPKRFAGYAVPASCNYRGCTEVINRGFDYACGQDGPNVDTCGGYYCFEHQNYDYLAGDDRVQCLHTPEDYDLSKPERPEWIEHVATDASWDTFRQTNPTWRQDWELS